MRAARCKYLAAPCFPPYGPGDRTVGLSSFHPPADSGGQAPTLQAPVRPCHGWTGAPRYNRGPPTWVLPGVKRSAGQGTPGIFAYENGKIGACYVTGWKIPRILYPPSGGIVRKGTGKNAKRNKTENAKPAKPPPPAPPESLRTHVGHQ